MSYFRQSNFPPLPEMISKIRTVKNGEWYLKIKPSDNGIDFVACNNQYSEWLWTVKTHSILFNFVFGDFQKRCKNAKEKYQAWVDNKNGDFIFYSQISDII